MSAIIENTFLRKANTFTDMQGHMFTLSRYSSMCQSVVEFGVRDGNSTWALLGGLPDRLTSYDIERRPEVDIIERVAAPSNTKFKFVLGSSLEVDIEEADMLFIDTLHTYDQLKQELDRHAHKARKFIAFHDTTTFEFVDEPLEKGAGKGLWPAIAEFLNAHPEWTIRERFTHCHGLTVLERTAK